MNKRELMFALLDDNATLPHVPAAFFLHFPPDFHRGQAAVDKHIEFFRHTGMDFVKIQYECGFPHLDFIQNPGDWSKMPRYGHDYFADQLAVVEGLVRAMKPEAVVVLTLYYPFMEARHTAGEETLTRHLNDDPEAVKRGLEIITESMLWFVRECIKLGIDGFYHSTQGGEAARFGDRHIFEQYIKPFDLVLMDEVNKACSFNILHVCDYLRSYDDFTPFVDYPGHIVNCPLQVGDDVLTPAEAARLFKRPYMGGMERKGVIATGTPEQIRQTAEAVIAQAPSHFVLAADCTVPNDTSWDNLKAAIDVAHTGRK
ncbi:MAG: hypothetical protein IH587_11635 [Anaerolineae bacterium]|nr:hypothetical protein [Anaerolineae bacterium]